MSFKSYPLRKKLEFKMPVSSPLHTAMTCPTLNFFGSAGPIVSTFFRSCFYANSYSYLHYFYYWQLISLILSYVGQPGQSPLEMLRADVLQALRKKLEYKTPVSSPLHTVTTYPTPSSFGSAGPIVSTLFRFCLYANSYSYLNYFCY